MFWADSTNTPINMGGCTAFAEFRTEPTSTSVLLTLSTANGRITLDIPSGRITMHLTAAETNLITWTAGYYDLEVHFPAIGNEVPVYKISRGKVKVIPSVTKGA